NPVARPADRAGRWPEPESRCAHGTCRSGGFPEQSFPAHRSAYSRPVVLRSDHRDEYGQTSRAERAFHPEYGEYPASADSHTASVVWHQPEISLPVTVPLIGGSVLHWFSVTHFPLRRYAA